MMSTAGNWNKRKIEETKISEEQKQILKAQEKIKKEQSKLIKCQGNNQKILYKKNIIWVNINFIVKQYFLYRNFILCSDNIDIIFFH